MEMLKLYNGGQPGDDYVVVAVGDDLERHWRDQGYTEEIVAAPDDVETEVETESETGVETEVAADNPPPNPDDSKSKSKSTRKRGDASG